MGKNGKKLSALLLSAALVLTGLPAVVLPVAAASSELLGSAGTFDNADVDYTNGICKTILQSGGSLVTDPDDASNTVLQYKGGTSYLNLSGYVESGVAYKFTCRMKGQKGVSGITAGTKKLTYHTTATNGDTAEAILVNVTEEWQTLTRYFIAGPNHFNPNYCMGLQSKNAAVYYDDFTLTPLAVTSVSLDKTLTLGAEATATLQPTLEPAGAQYSSMSWNSSDPTVATVDDSGNVTAQNKSGNTTVTVTVVSAEGTFTDSCTVTVGETATGIALSHTELYLSTPTEKAVAAKTLGVTAQPLGAYVGTISWGSSNAAVATVDSTGKVTAQAEGTAVITATSELGFRATCQVMVDPYSERITGGDFENEDWKTTQWQTEIINANNSSVVADPDDATNHVLKVTNTSTRYYWNSPLEEGKTYTLTFRAKGAKLITYIHTSYTVSGDRGHLSAQLSNTEWTTLTYTFTTVSANLNINYVFGFKNAGSGDVYVDDVSLVQLPQATALSAVPAVGELFPGRSMTLTVKTTPSAASSGALTWTSSNPSIATVDQNGKVTAVSESGTVTITATNPDGLTATATVTVTEYANLILNGDFEQGHANWSSDQAAYFQSGIGKDGTAGLMLTANSNGSKQDFFCKSALPITAATRYILTFDYFLSETGSIRVWSDNNFGCSFTPDHTVRGSWKTASYIFTTSPDLTLNTGWDLAFVAEAGTAVIDNVTLRMYSTGVSAESITLNPGTLTLAFGIEPNAGDCGHARRQRS